MSLYIKGLDLPHKGQVPHRLSIDDEGIVIMGGRYTIYRAVDLLPHGRLGDLDELERMFSDIDNAPYSGFDGAEPFYSADDAAQIIRLAPTIIPADGEEEAEAALRRGADG